MPSFCHIAFIQEGHPDSGAGEIDPTFESEQLPENVWLCQSTHQPTFSILSSRAHLLLTKGDQRVGPDQNLTLWSMGKEVP